jgi:alpha-tubulin suppressor-like RCC1 family protein
LVADPVPSAITLPATSITATSAILNGKVNASNGGVVASFDYGSDTSYGTNIVATPAIITGGADTKVQVVLTGLTPSAQYHFRVNGGTANGGDLTFNTPNNNANISSLILSDGALSPVFASGTASYSATVPSTTAFISVTPIVADSNANVTVNGVAVASGSACNPVSLNYGNNPAIVMQVVAQDGTTTKTYTITDVIRLPPPLSANYASSSDVPLTTSSFIATGDTVNFALNYSPVPGTMLTVINNTGPGFITGAFSNLAQGQTVLLSYNGITYPFVANYFGGTGNDLVLQWAHNRAFAWGLNSSGQLGDVTTVQRNLPVPVNTLAYYDSMHFTNYPGVLSGKTVISVAAGGSHSMALCSDGTFAAWGYNGYGELGGGGGQQSNVAVAVSVSNPSSLNGKKVAAIAAGAAHSMALCSDGTVSTWGNNANGQLGNNSTITSYWPVAVNVSHNVINGKLVFSALYGKTLVAIAAGQNHCLALCSDGTVAAWGYNGNGQLGTNTTTSSIFPVAVNKASGISALFGKTVIGIAAGGNHSIALCSDGTLAAWGGNSSGQLGDGTTTQRKAPVAVSTAAGVSALAGRTVVAVAGGGTHSLALCSDGTVAAWGANANGQLGDTTLTNENVPVAVSTAAGSSALAGKTVASIAASASTSFALTADGTLTAWGADASGQIGDNATTDESAPVTVNSSPLAVGEAFTAVFAGSSASHTLALAASPLTPVVKTLAATVITGTGVTLNGTVNANYNSSSVTFDYGLDTTYGTNVSGTPATLAGASATAASVTVTGLSPSTTYHFRLDGVSAVGSRSGADLTFTTLSLLQNWRQMNFGTSANSGSTADAGDYDGDGIPNLLEYALNLNPQVADKLPVAAAVNGTNFEYSYSRSTGAVNAGAAFVVECSDTLAAGSWSSSGVVQTVLSDDGTTQQVKAVIPVNAANTKFVRLSVTAPP